MRLLCTDHLSFVSFYFLFGRFIPTSGVEIVHCGQGANIVTQSRQFPVLSKRLVPVKLNTSRGV